MKQILAATVIPALLAWSASFEAVHEKADHALSLGHVKEAETFYINFLNTASDEDISFAKTQLAMAYYKDQEHEKAFEIFLEALEQTKVNEPARLSEEESQAYALALKIYVDHAGLTPEETAQKIAHEFKATFEKNPNFYHLGYILAMGYANLGRYDHFFNTFYQSYRNDPKHFLAFKAKAALHVKLFERAKTEEQRQKERRLIINNAEQAAALQPADSSLYRMILGFTPDDSKAAVLSMYLNKIIDQNIVISRIDIPYYAEIAIAFEQYALAQKFLDKAKEWYAYSRVITVAQQRLNDRHPQK